MYSVQLNLLEFELTPDTPTWTLEPGDYEIELTYRNNYGDRCFNGTVQAEQSAKLHLEKTLVLRRSNR